MNCPRRFGGMNGFTPDMPDIVESPCNSVCEIDTASGYCIGCGRTLGDIAEWGEANPEQQRAILVMLADRLAQLGRTENAARGL